jgi:predicted enzyme related to lactoylglutathione lyase
MENQKEPTFGNGKICYIVIPARDVDEAANFYETVFNWTIRKGEDGSVSFDDGVNEVSGVWVKGLKPATEKNGLSIHIMVDDMQATLKLLVDKGGMIETEVDKNSPEITASFSDPTGNIFGLYQHQG